MELPFSGQTAFPCSFSAVAPFPTQRGGAIIKHTTPCGLAVGTSAIDAYRKALACDPVSAFGSVIAFTVPVDAATADAVSSLFVEVVVAPSFADEAVEILGRKKNLRVLEGRATWPANALDYKRSEERRVGKEGRSGWAAG